MISVENLFFRSFFRQNYSDVFDAPLELWRIVGLEIIWIWKFYRVYFIFFDGLDYKKLKLTYIISNASKHFSKSFIFGYIFQFGLYFVESNISSPEGGDSTLHDNCLCLVCHATTAMLNDFC